VNARPILVVWGEYPAFIRSKGLQNRTRVLLNGLVQSVAKKSEIEGLIRDFDVTTEKLECVSPEDPDPNP